MSQKVKKEETSVGWASDPIYPRNKDEKSGAENIQPLQNYRSLYG
jgi:hypothetical protein